MKVGDVVTCETHEYKMCIHSVEGNKVVADYFIDSELIRKEYELSELVIDIS